MSAYEFSMVGVVRFITSLPNRIQGRFQHRVLPNLLAAWVTLTFPLRRKAKAHGLSAPLIISLTSYPARFSKLDLTLKCLLSQTMAADKVILWIAHQDKAKLTPAILKLQNKGLEIGYCDDLRSYKKIIPALQNYSDSFIVTADDDLYYWPTWLAELVENYDGNVKDVVCHRAHRINLSEGGVPLPYSTWEFEISQHNASVRNFPTSGAGALYPPNIFFSDVLNAELFQKLCPNADDVWLYWMMRLNSGVARKIDRVHPLHCWQDSQIQSLYHQNVAGGGNDQQIIAMTNTYGYPHTL